MEDQDMILYECPFCGSDDVRMGIDRDDGPHCVVRCSCCGTEVHIPSSVEGAAKILWNNRA